MAKGDNKGDELDRDADFSKLGVPKAGAREPEQRESAPEKQQDRVSEQGNGEPANEDMVEESIVEAAENESRGAGDGGLEKDVEFLTKELERVENELQDYKDKYLRTLAEADNIRKRAAKERSELLKYQGEKIVGDLLDVVDNLERAIATPGADYEKFKQGVELIYRRFVDILSKWEIRGESGIGQVFDPAKHEAISKVPADDAAPGTIINELKRAFFYKDKLLRPGEVVVVSGPTAGDRESDSGSENDAANEDTTEIS